MGGLVFERTGELKYVLHSDSECTTERRMVDFGGKIVEEVVRPLFLHLPPIKQEKNCLHLCLPRTSFTEVLCRSLT